MFGTNDSQKQALICDKLSMLSGVGYNEKSECKRLSKEIRSHRQIHMGDQQLLEKLYLRHKSQC